MSDYDDWDVDDGMAPEGPPEVMLHLSLVGLNGWPQNFKDALLLREHMEAGKPPLGDSGWAYELNQLNQQLHPDLNALLYRLAWAAYRQGVLHGELLERERIYPTIK